MRSNRQGEHPQSRVTPLHLLAAAAILGLLIMPVAFAQDGEVGPTKSAKVMKQIKKLKQRLAALEAGPTRSARSRRRCRRAAPPPAISPGPIRTR